MEALTDDRGVLKRIMRTGTGPVVAEGAIVRREPCYEACGCELLLIHFPPTAVHYNGYLEYSDEPFDSSRLRNQVLQFRLGHGEVIPG